jgi:hypothetical protein
MHGIIKPKIPFLCAHKPYILHGLLISSCDLVDKDEARAVGCGALILAIRVYTNAVVVLKGWPLLLFTSTPGSWIVRMAVKLK